MLHWILQTFETALPFIIPLGILTFTKRPTFAYTWRSQRLCVSIFYVLYGFSLLLFVAHCYAVKAGLSEFFQAFWGSPLRMTVWSFSGYLVQILCCVTLLVTINWGTIRLFSPRLRDTPPLKNLGNKPQEDEVSTAFQTLNQKPDKSDCIKKS